MAKQELSDLTRKAIEMAHEESYRDFHRPDPDDGKEISYERSVSVELTTSEACFIMELIDLKIKAHKSYANQAMDKGYRSAASEVKRDKHLKRAEELKLLTDKLMENLV